MVALLTDADRLADALAKLHALKTGRLSVSVDVDGRRVRYARVDIEVLQAYVDELTAKVNGKCPRYGAIGFIL